MTNYEKYKNEIEKFARLNVDFALDKETRKIIICAGFSCSQCEFNKSTTEYTCENSKLIWADAEYIEPEVDWSKVPIDTPVLVSDDKKIWVRRHFATPALKNDDPFTVRTFVDGKTEWSSTAMREEELESCERWRYAKLAEKVI